MIRISDIRTDGGTQARAAIDEATVADYAEAMADPNTVFPPIIVYYDGKHYWLADGFHRLAAWVRVGREEVPAEIRQGDRRRAILHSVAANAAHGLRRSNADKRRAVMTLLEDAEWSQWSNAEIARRCAVSDKTVAKVREEMGEPHLRKSEDSAVRTVERGGKAYQQDTSKIGKAAAKPAEEPATEPAREPAADAAADKAGISVAETAAGGPATEPEPDRSQTGAEPEPAEETAPDPDAAERAELRKLSQQGLEDEIIGLRAENAELRAALEDEKAKARKLREQLADLTADDKHEVIRRQHQTIEHMRSQMFRANEEARIAVRMRRKAEDARDEALRKLGEQVIPLDY